jgi:hypothetical protein
MTLAAAQLLVFVGLGGCGVSGDRSGAHVARKVGGARNGVMRGWQDAEVSKYRNHNVVWILLYNASRFSQILLNKQLAVAL